jgi:hypothetical protein
MAVINQNNFLRWDDQNTSTAQPALPRPYRRDRGGCPYMPVAYPTEIMSFYINNPSGFLAGTAFSGAAFSDLRLDIVNASSNAIIASIGGTPLHQVFLDAPTNTTYQIWGSFTIPTLVNGMYYLQVTRIAAGIPVLKSNYIYVRNDKAVLDRETTYIKFRHDRQFYGVRYQDIPGFYQQFRIHLNVLEKQIETDKEIYREVTTGRVRTSENYISRFYRMESYYFDDDAHDACGAFFEHSYKEINGKLYSIKSTYKENPNQLSVYSKGEAECYDDAYSSVNRC